MKFGLLKKILVAGLIGWLNEAYFVERWNWLTIARPYMLTQVRPYVLTAERERTLKPRETFRECAEDCPEMVVLPAREFMMGSTSGPSDEGPQHKVAFAQPFAVSTFEVTFNAWDACVKVGGCARVSDGDYGRGKQPVINVTWHEARQYVAWLSRMTGRAYRLLSESEWEYAARAGTQTTYWWGNDIDGGKANCMGCGSPWDNKRPAPVGSFAANAFGLHDMHGNVWEWVEDCYQEDYSGAPADGAARTSAECSRRVMRGGAWNNSAWNLRSTIRLKNSPVNRGDDLGFRVARTLNP